MPKIPSKSFNQWTQQTVKKAFHLVQLENHQTLEEWLKIQLPPDKAISEAELTLLKKVQKEAIPFVESWTEQEMIMKFISFIVRAAELDQPQYKTFSDRSLSARVDGQKLWGRVDLMVASGEFEPESPYFCFHEYKRQGYSHSDPMGQLLATMLAAQALNQNAHPIYGVYVIGQLWHFVILDKRDYAISRAYLVTQDDLWDIIRLLKGLNLIIPNLTRIDQD